MGEASFNVTPKDFVNAYEKLMEALDESETKITVQEAVVGGAFLSALNAAKLGIPKEDLNQLNFYAAMMAYNAVERNEEE